MHSILLVEDSEDFQKIVLRTLGNHRVTCVTTVDEAKEIMEREQFDLVLLDITLPKKNGYSLLQELNYKKKSVSIPIICLTAKGDVTDKVTAFSLGADDYIVKPFDPLELKARVEAKISKHLAASSPSLVTVGPLEIDLASHRVNLVNGSKKNEVILTQTEFKLLCCLTKSLNRVYTRDQLLVAAWGEDASVNDRVVDVHLCSLRKKMGPVSRAIQAVPGVGYRFSLETVSKKAA